jgi:hypothetical protein
MDSYVINVASKRIEFLTFSGYSSEEITTILAESTASDE